MPPDKHAAANGLLRLRRRLQHCDPLFHQLLVSQQLQPRELLLLWVCQRQGNRFSTQLDVARFLGVSPAQMSGLVDRLRRRQLLVGVRDPQDRRRQRWSLSPLGADALRQSLATVETRLAALGAEYQLELFTELDRLLEQMEAVLPMAAGLLRDGGTCSETQGDAFGKEAA